MPLRKKANCSKWIEKASYAFFIIDLRSGKFEYVSSSIKQVIGFTVKEVIDMGGNGLYERISGKQRCDVNGLFINPAKKQTPKQDYVEISFKHKKGHYVWAGVHKDLITNNKGKSTAIGLIRDITATKWCWDQLDNSKTLYYNAQVAKYRTRISDSRMLECNHSMARMLGYENREQCLQQHYSIKSYVNPRDRKELMKLAELQGKIDGVEVQACRIDGSPLWMKISAQAYPEKDFVEGVIWDITAEKILTATEKQILKEIMLGKSSKEIAYQIKRSIRTIEDHRANIMRKLGAHNLVELTQKAMETAI